MLEFFRKYQRYFFVVITIVIVISFSFFGTYNSLIQEHPNEQILFTAIDGTSVKRSDVEEMAQFLGTDAFDKKVWGGMWGPNFLNDGVIVNDFIKTGLANILITDYALDLESDFNLRFEKEKRFQTYSHPEAKFLSVENAWSYFFPAMKQNYEQLKQADSPLAPEAINAKLQLYLNQREFPAYAMRQILLQQQRQYSWLKEDPNLEYTDFSLFGYNTLEDWFGPRFVRLVSAFIINTAKIAEQKGYTVSKNEALADLMRNAVISYNENAQNPNLGVTNASDYYQEQLRRLGMDQNKAVKVWQQIMLFRRLFDDVSNTVFNDPLVFNSFNNFAQQMVKGELYHLPKDLHLNDFRKLQKFEVYLDAIAKRNDKDLLKLPTDFLSAEEVLKKNPELVEKKYTLEVAKINKTALQSKVGIKETWNWEGKPENWEKLKQQFPELGVKSVSNSQERLAVLDALDDKTRQRLDTFARNAIVDAHPEMIERALDQAEMQTISLGVHPKGKNKFFAGLENGSELMKILDEVSLNEVNSVLKNYTPDQVNFYRIKVLNRSNQYQILTFAEAENESLLEPILDKKLEEYYKKNRDSHPDLFQTDMKSWKPFSEVKNKVADLYFAKILEAIRADYAQAIAPEKTPSTMLGDYAASLRFYAYMREAKNQIQKDSANHPKYVLNSSNDQEENRQGLGQQWLLIKETASATRSHSDKVNLSDAFNLNPKEWTKVQHLPNGDIYFFEVTYKGENEDQPGYHKKLNDVQVALGDDAQQVFTQKLLESIKLKKAISLDYLKYQGEEH